MLYQLKETADLADKRKKFLPLSGFWNTVDKRIRPKRVLSRRVENHFFQHTRYQDIENGAIFIT